MDRGKGKAPGRERARVIFLRSRIQTKKGKRSRLLFSLRKSELLIYNLENNSPFWIRITFRHPGVLQDITLDVFFTSLWIIATIRVGSYGIILKAYPVKNRIRMTVEYFCYESIAIGLETVSSLNDGTIFSCRECVTKRLPIWPVRYNAPIEDLYPNDTLSEMTFA